MMPKSKAGFMAFMKDLLLTFVLIFTPYKSYLSVLCYVMIITCFQQISQYTTVIHEVKFK